MPKDRGDAQPVTASKQDQLPADRRNEVRDDTTAPDEAAHWLLFETVSLGLFEAGLSGEIRRCNAAAVELLTGSPRGRLESELLSDYFDSEEEWETLAEDLSRTGLVAGRELMMRREGGGTFWAQLDVRLVLPSNADARLVGVVQDITARKHRETRLRQSASHDPLTGLPHRGTLMEHLKRETARMRRDLTHSFAVAFCDLDNFKIINEEHGHLVGDQLLLAVAHRLKRGLRPEDTVYRYGGDEFAMVLQGVDDVNSAAVVGHRMLEVLQSPFRIQSGLVEVTASVGIRLCEAHDVDPDQLLHSADQAMYAAKRREGGQAVRVVTQ